MIPFLDSLTAPNLIMRLGCYHEVYKSRMGEIVCMNFEGEIKEIINK